MGRAGRNRPHSCPLAGRLSPSGGRRPNSLGTSFDSLSPYRQHKNWGWWCLLSSDRHWDNPKSKHKLQRYRLEQAQERGAAVVDCSDLFCVMQGKYDKRASKSAVRPEHQVDDYLDAIVTTAADWFVPFARNFVVIGVGNHEAAIMQRHETNLIERFITLMNVRTGSRIYNGGYSGFVSYHFAPEGGARDGKTVLLYYDQGFGGGQVTHDAIQHQRRAVYLPDPEIVISRHTHDAWVKEFARVRCTPQGRLYQDIQTHIKLPIYKEEYEDGFSGWHATTGKPPKPLGSW